MLAARITGLSRGAEDIGDLAVGDGQPGFGVYHQEDHVGFLDSGLGLLASAAHDVFFGDFALRPCAGIGCDAKHHTARVNHGERNSTSTRCCRRCGRESCLGWSSHDGDLFAISLLKNDDLPTLGLPTIARTGLVVPRHSSPVSNVLLLCCSLEI